MEENMGAVVDPVIEEPVPVVEEPVVEASTAEPEEPEAVPAASEEPVAVSEEPVIEELVVTEPKPEIEESAAPTIEEQYSALQSEHQELQTAFSNLETSYNELQSRFSALEASHAGLVEFKNKIDDAQKDQMIESFYMLSDEDKQEIVANKSKFTVEEIEEKLSVICFRKGNFDLSNTSNINNITEAPVVTFNLQNVHGASKPAWLTAVDYVKNNKN